MPNSITSDSDLIFVSQFWFEFFKLQGVQLNKSTTYHPQTDGQSETVNTSLETYLRCMCSHQQSTWSKWLSLAEWWYNTNCHTSIQTTPYEIVYGQPSPIHLPYLPGSSHSATVNISLLAREDALKIIKFHLLRAQNKMSQLLIGIRSDRLFSIGDYVLLKLHPYRQLSLKHHRNHKLLPKFFGPFKILDKIGATAYKLELHPIHSYSQCFSCISIKTLSISFCTCLIFVEIPR